MSNRSNGAGKLAAGDEDSVVAAHGERLAQRGSGAGRPHGHGRHPAAAFVPQQERQLNGIQVHRVDDALDALADDGARLLVHADIAGLGHLLDADDDAHVLPC
jgi:hypothetical protein